MTSHKHRLNTARSNSKKAKKTNNVLLQLRAFCQHLGWNCTLCVRISHISILTSIWPKKRDWARSVHKYAANGTEALVIREVRIYAHHMQLCNTRFSQNKMAEFSGGYEYEFLSPVPEKWRCIICHLPLNDPVQIVSCGHRICQRCMDAVMM